MTKRNFFNFTSSKLLVCLVMVMFGPIPPGWIWLDNAQEGTCEYWAAPTPLGNDNNPGTITQPWATLEYATTAVPDDNCTVWFKNGLYIGKNNPKRRFTTQTTFRAIEPYMVAFENSGPVIKLDGAKNMVFEGFEFRHSGEGAIKHVVIMDRRDDIWTEHITFRNNIFHDSYNNDLLKIHNGNRFVTIENNVFYNQGESDQHIDVNSVTDIIIQDNIFFNDFSGSGRTNTNNTKHFIVVKDSNEESDGQLGSQRIKIRRNIFLNWEGGAETFVQIGNDGKPYYEAQNVLVENNLFIGNSSSLIGAAFGVKGAKNVNFNNNTVVGNLPAKAYAFRVAIAGLNPINDNIIFTNNIWSDPTGSMGVDLSGGPGEFSDGNSTETKNLFLDNNLYWNQGMEIPPGDLVSPLIYDERAIIADPLIDANQDQIVLPRWNGTSFQSGSNSIRDEFVHLVEHYAAIPSGSSAIGKADPSFAPNHDILGNPRSATPDLGAYEYRIQLNGRSGLIKIALNWTPPHEMGATSLMITYSHDAVAKQVTGIPVTATALTLKDLKPYSFYTIFLTAHAEDGTILSKSNQLVLLTTDFQIIFPSVFKHFFKNIFLINMFSPENFSYEQAQ